MLNRKATLHELQTVYGPEDAYDMIEMILVENRNKEIAQQNERED